ncbi:MAG: response regulator [Candidatus Omnitrophica bacterium]|nr:response regulator [Candidatus Omnitrophota bacterium]
MVDQFAIQYQSPLRVLVVEDNPVDLTVIKSMLTGTTDNYTFLKTASTIKTALEIIEEYPIDVVILDLNLPDSQGEKTLQTVHNRFNDLTIVVNTGAYEEELGLHTLSNGAQDFLVKGRYTAYTLNKVLHFAIKRKKLETELTRTVQQVKDAQEQLLQAEKMNVVGILASGIAHEVRNPLATILYGITYLHENIRVEDKNYHHVLKNIKEATKRANDIISDLLDFSKFKKLQLDETNIHHVIKKALSLIQYEIDKKTLQIVNDFQNSIPPIKIDQNRIEQVIVNLLLNAIHATEEGKISIRTYTRTLSNDLTEIPQISRKNFTPGQQALFCSIDDSGSGIPAEDIDQVFYPFFTSRRAKGGIGLGLYVARNIIDIHKGALILKNNEDKGAQAIVVLPYR